MSFPGKNRSALLRASLGVGAALVLVSGLGVFEGVGLAASAVLPTSTAPPTISGTPIEGQKLTASTGTWTGTTPITFTYHWQRCNATGGSCVGPIATSSTITLGTLSAGKTFRVKVTATNADGARSSTSVPTAVIAAPAATTSNATTTTSTSTSTSTSTKPNGCATSGGTIPVADVQLPAQLSIDGTQVSPSTVTYGTRSLTIRIHVSACGGSVDGALVYVTAVPYGMFAVPNEQTTGSDGWATLQFSALAGFPVSQKQQLLVVFVRATAPGVSVIGGISARLLVSFRVTRG
jgi:hypothetical protein